MRRVVFTGTRRGAEKRSLGFFLSISLVGFALGLLPRMPPTPHPMIGTWFTQVWLIAVSSLAVWPLRDARSSSLRIAAQAMIVVPMLLAIACVTAGLQRELGVPSCGFPFFTKFPTDPLLDVVIPLYCITALAGPTLLVLGTSLQRAEEQASLPKEQ